ncbi:MAG: hypothetical protein JKY62_16675 [Desulfocapsa sp.]|nr:hypothetical protein [Desulfocapsa sp.]
MKKQIASISGGRTSHYMIDKLIEVFGKENVDFIFCNTGAEHKGTYDFVQATALHFDIDIVCLTMHMPQEEGIGAKYVVENIANITGDYTAFRELMTKYGRPFNPGGKFCTDQLKTQIYRKYCNDAYGKGNYVTWIGYRDEPRDASRSWGHTLSATLTKWLHIEKRDQGEFYKNCSIKLADSIGELFNYVSGYVVDPLGESGYNRVNKIVGKVVRNDQIGYRFLFEISDFNKEDIRAWWRTQSIDLEIPDHCGNCVFCIEKTENQLSYLCHTQKPLADEWLVQVTNPEIPIKGRKFNEEAMYHTGPIKLTFKEIYDKAFEQPQEYWESRVSHEKRLSPCAEGSCDLYGGED